jgi:transcriptional regulator with XRE-family HTH domain
MLDRIKEIMHTKGLSPSAFADEIGVQRPVISHILNGRNKPSLEIVQKIIQRFDDIDIGWLLTGVKIKTPAIENTAERIDEPQLFKSISNYSLETNSKEQEIEKIVFFYRNGTFKIYQSN